MHFSKENIRYALATWDELTHDEITSHADQAIPISGLYNWKNAFNGSFAFPRTSEEMEKFNVFHVNITARNLPLIARIRKIIDRSKTLLIGNVDYAVELWAQNFPYPDLFWQELDRCDKIFAVEESMAEIIELNLKRTVPVIPHPCNVTEIQKFQKTNRASTVGVSTHRYDQNYYLPALAFNAANLPKHFTSSVFGSTDKGAAYLHLYDTVIPTVNFQTLIEICADLLCVLESYTISSYGRTTIECAALGVPCIGSSKISSMRRCFPSLIAEPTQFARTAKLLREICLEPSFFTECARNGIKESLYYSFENCSSMFLDFLNSPKD